MKSLKLQPRRHFSAFAYQESEAYSHSTLWTVPPTKGLWTLEVQGPVETLGVSGHLIFGATKIICSCPLSYGRAYACMAPDLSVDQIRRRIKEKATYFTLA
ncbi:hypothetical protein AKJ16_DCAP18961 [Drosera capensis]